MDNTCDFPELSAESAQLAAETLKALAHPLRLRLLIRLLEREDYVSSLARRLDVAQPVVSQQLGVLKSHGLVRSETREGCAYYSIREPHIGPVLNCICRCMASRRKGPAG
ncbi:MAG TPA: transcriptional regulator [Phycisphaerales bacterium]|nr:transcriptional regulator [Phycisphaerales bacterium]